MRYIYGTDDSYSTTRGKRVTAKQLASIIKRDVDVGKWNHYYGGETDSRTAKCTYKKRGFVYHEQMLIYGTRKEFERLESLIKPFIEVKPRKFIN